MKRILGLTIVLSTIALQANAQTSEQIAEQTVALTAIQTASSVQAATTAQSIPAAEGAGDDESLFGEYRAAFSPEGRKLWKPEVTARVNLGIFNGSEVLGVGVRVHKHHSMGILVGQGNVYIDAAPGDIQYVQAALYKRLYLPFGHREIVSIYSDIYLGAGVVYNVSGKYYEDPITHEQKELINGSRGDVLPIIGWQPGIRLRLFRSANIFLGPTIATNCLGVHMGLGF